MQWLGELFDGSIGIRRTAIWRDDKGRVVVAANESIMLPKIGHSSVLCDPAAFQLVEDSGLPALILAPACGVLGPRELTLTPQ